MSTPQTRSNKSEPQNPSPVKGYYRVKDANLEISYNKEKSTPERSAGPFSAIGHRFFLYMYDKSTGVGYESTEYNLKSDTVSVYKNEEGQRKKVWTGTVDEARKETKMFEGSKLMAGMSVYAHNHQEELKGPSKIQLSASGRNEYMSFQDECSNRYPDFWLSVRETQPADRKNAKGSLPDFLPCFEQLTREQGESLENSDVLETETLLVNFWMGVSAPQTTTSESQEQGRNSKHDTGSAGPHTSESGDDLPF